MYLVSCKDARFFCDNNSIPYDSMHASSTKGKNLFIATRLIRVAVFKNKGPAEIFVFIKDPLKNKRIFKAHFLIAMYKILLFFKKFYAHAGAIKFKKKVYLFFGEKSAGKSTICLNLAKKGARIISDDHVMLTKGAKRMFVSGSEETSRIDKRTERHLFTSALKIKPKRIGSRLKKEFLLAPHFSTAPYQDFKVDSIFFINRTGEFSIKKIPKIEVVLRLLSSSRRLFRFKQHNEFEEYLHFFSGLGKNLNAFILQLGNRKLSDLDRIESFLK